MRSAPSSLLAAALLLAAGCASAPGPATAPGLPTVEVPDLELRALLLLLVDRQAYEPFTVDQALRGGAELREELAVSLGRIGDRQARSVLVGLLLDPEVAVRRAAAFALGELEDPGAALALLEAVTAPDRETGVLAVEALGKLGEPLSEVERRLAALAEEERQARLLPHLFRFEDPGKVPAAERGLASPVPALHGRAAYALAREPRPEAAPALRRLLADPDPWVRGWAARALGEVGDGTDLERLRPLLDDAAAGPIVQALRAGARLVDAGKAAAPPGWRPRLLALVDDPRAGVRVTALEAAAEWLLDDELGTALAARADSGRGRERGTALVALATAGDPRAADLATRAATAEDPDVRARAAEAAGRLRASELLRRLAADPSAEARGAAFDAWLAALTPNETPAADPGAAEAGPRPAPSEAVEVALAALADPDAGVRSVGLSWATAHPAVPLEALERALAASLADRTVESGLEAVRALAARAGAEPLERGAIVARLEQVATGGDWVLRREAANALVGLGRPALEPGPVAIQKDAAAYREVVQRTWRPRTVEIATDRGALRVRLACPQAPLTCLNLLTLAAQGFYDGILFHRVVPDFVVQAGDPRGDGYGGPGYTIRDEIGRLRYGRGVMGMALAGPDTGGSQFFLTLSPQPHLDGGYTAFGEVVAGEEVLDRIEADDRILTIREVREGS